MQAIGSGAEGYLLKEIDELGLVRAIKEVAEGRSILDPAVTRRVFNRVKEGAATPQSIKLDRLSAQERRVLELVALAKAKPGMLNYASSGVGSANHLAGELLKFMAGGIDDVVENAKAMK